MRTWDDYKTNAKAIDQDSKKQIEEIELLAAIIGELIERRQEMGYTQRDLARECGMPQSSVARIESCKMIPKLDTVIRLMKPLGLKLIIEHETIGK